MTGKVWKRTELTDEALIEAVSFIRALALSHTAPHYLVVEAKRIEAILPPLVEPKGET